MDIVLAPAQQAKQNEINVIIRLTRMFYLSWIAILHIRRRPIFHVCCEKPEPFVKNTR